MKLFGILLSLVCWSVLVNGLRTKRDYESERANRNKNRYYLKKVADGVTQANTAVTGLKTWKDQSKTLTELHNAAEAVEELTDKGKEQAKTLTEITKAADGVKDQAKNAPADVLKRFR